MPLSVETPAPGEDDAARRPCAAGRRASATLSHAREQLGERHVLERLDDEVGLREVERARDVVRDSDAEDARRARGRDPVRRVLDRDRLVRVDAEQLERLEVERRARLAAARCRRRRRRSPPSRRRDSSRSRFGSTQERVLLETMADADAERRASSRYSRTPGRSGSELEQLELAAPPRRRHRVAVAGRLEQRIELVELVRPRQRADAQREAVDRHRDAVRVEDLAPACAGRSTRCRRACRRSRKAAP